MSAAIDTNVLVRVLVQDPTAAAQCAAAKRVVAEASASGEPLLITLCVLLETEWVLRSRYDLPKRSIIETISGLLDATDVQFEDEPAVEEALFIWKDSSADFADCLIGARNRRLGCRATASFDAKAAKLPGFVAA